MDHLPSTTSIRASHSLSRDTHSPRQLPPYLALTRAASPMSIPNRARIPAPPPPLPPPTNVEELGLTQEQAWAFHNNPHWHGFPTGPASEASGDRSRKNSDELMVDAIDMDTAARKHSVAPIASLMAAKDGDRERSLGSREDGQVDQSTNYRLHSERQLEQRSLSTSSKAYDRNLLSKIGGPNTPLRNPSYSSNNGDAVTVSPRLSDVRPPAVKRLSMPERRRSSNDARFGVTSSSRTNSSAANILSPTAFRTSSIFEPTEHDRRNGRRQGSMMFDDGPTSHHGCHEASIFKHEEFTDQEGQMKDLSINDRRPGDAEDTLAGPRPGMKRRASSPQRETSRLDRSSLGSSVGPNDLYYRRSMQQFPPRSSPASHHVYPNHGSVSSASSIGPRTASLASSVGLSVASSATSFASGRFSPNTHSPAIDPELCPAMPGPKSLNPSPRSSISNHHLYQNGGDQGANHPSLMTMIESHHAHQPVPGVLICDCCPKKPKKFATEEDLRLHHMEKQYTCLFCPNRFKNKNEAERHQNSLHLRKHSWSCAALPSIEHAFHTSTANGSASDVCGYCGAEFPNPADWDERRSHLSVTHKYGECNQAKKFFRADHFRQHLKHSHAGTSGKWTNVLENACMRDEPPPIPMNRGSLGSMSAHPGMYAPMPNTLPPPMGLVPPGFKPETINEVPQER